MNKNLQKKPYFSPYLSLLECCVDCILSSVQTDFENKELIGTDCDWELGG